MVVLFCFYTVFSSYVCLVWDRVHGALRIAILEVGTPELIFKRLCERKFLVLSHTLSFNSLIY